MTRKSIFIFTCIILLNSCQPEIKVIEKKDSLKITPASKINFPTPTATEFLTNLFDAFYNTTIKYPEWKIVSPGLEIKEIAVKINEQLDDTVVILRINPQNFSFKILQNVKQPQTISDWLESSKAVVLVNGNYFMENFQTAGYLVIDNKEFGELKKIYNGMFLVKNGVPEIRCLPNQTYQYSSSIEFAINNFPVMIYNSQNLLSGNSVEMDRRTVIAKDKNNNILLIVNRKPNFTLFEMAKFLEKSDLKIETALNLDGGTSTGLAMRVNDFCYVVPSLNQIPNVIAIYKK